MGKGKKCRRKEKSHSLFAMDESKIATGRGVGALILRSKKEKRGGDAENRLHWTERGEGVENRLLNQMTGVKQLDGRKKGLQIVWRLKGEEGEKGRGKKKAKSDSKEGKGRGDQHEYYEAQASQRFITKKNKKRGGLVLQKGGRKTKTAHLPPPEGKRRGDLLRVSRRQSISNYSGYWRRGGEREAPVIQLSLEGGKKEKKNFPQRGKGKEKGGKEVLRIQRVMGKRVAASTAKGGDEAVPPNSEGGNKRKKGAKCFFHSGEKKRGGGKKGENFPQRGKVESTSLSIWKKKKKNSRQPSGRRRKGELRSPQKKGEELFAASS